MPQDSGSQVRAKGIHFLCNYLDSICMLQSTCMSYSSTNSYSKVLPKLIAMFLWIYILIYGQGFSSGTLLTIITESNDVLFYKKTWKILFFILFRPARNKFNIASYCFVSEQEKLFCFQGLAALLPFYLTALPVVHSCRYLFYSPVWERLKSFVLPVNRI